MDPTYVLWVLATALVPLAALPYFFSPPRPAEERLCHAMIAPSRIKTRLYAVGSLSITALLTYLFLTQDSTSSWPAVAIWSTTAIVAMATAMVHAFEYSRIRDWPAMLFIWAPYAVLVAAVSGSLVKGAMSIALASMMYPMVGSVMRAVASLGEYASKRFRVDLGPPSS